MSVGASPISQQRQDIDPVLVEIVRNGVIALTEEMKINLTRTAYNMIIYEALDFTVGLYTVEGDTISIGLGLPSFIRGMSETVKAKVAHFGIENIHPGDILVTNDAFITGSHLNHITLTKPVFWHGRVVAFTCCMAHWIDIGGSKGEVTTDIYSEGVQVPILKFRSGGKINEDFLSFIKLNVRMVDHAMGDLRAQVTAVETGEKRMLEMLQRHGHETVLAAIEDIMDHSDKVAREKAALIPDGVYEAESFMDDDGVSIGERLPVRVRVEVANGEVTVDLSGVSPQVKGYYNSAGATGIACAQVAFKCLTTPDIYPVNDGAFRSLKVICPQGTAISAKRPAAMRWWMTIPMTVVDTIIKAVAPAVPHLTAGGHHADLCVAQFHGSNPRSGRFFVGVVGPSGGGWGATAVSDGNPVTVCSNDGDTHNSPSEQVETKYPILIERYALREDSGGAGEFRGGLGADIVIRALAPVELSTAIERCHCAPWGVMGGQPGAANRLSIATADGWEILENGKTSNMALEPGDRIRIETGGGGGFGDPQLRQRESVISDVREGYVSAERAHELYGFPQEAPR
ncbi:hydantoinase B/oxoprolinase family protein [Pelagibacterium sp.]|uniref:hydantoinase B/oxoprolinase family protein n=1 Tax=Pelagibacterium sp. TaxID=1967288 RepID=UPI003A8F1F2B